MKERAIVKISEKRGGNHHNTSKTTVNKSKSPLNYNEYIEYLQKTIIDDVNNETKYYKSISVLIKGMENNFSTHPFKRLPSVKTQQDYIRIFMYGKARKNEHEVSYRELEKRCIKNHAKNCLIKLMSNVEFPYDICYYNDKETPTKETYPQLFFFCPLGLENEISIHLNNYFDSDIKAMFVGIKCLMIIFDNFEKQENFTNEIHEILGEREIISND